MSKRKENPMPHELRGWKHGGCCKTREDLYQIWLNLCYFHYRLPVKGWADYLDFRQWCLDNGYQKDLTRLARLDEKDIYCPENVVWKPKGRGYICHCCVECGKSFWEKHWNYVSCPICNGEILITLSQTYENFPIRLRSQLLEKEAQKERRRLLKEEAKNTAKKASKKTPAGRSMPEVKKEPTEANAAATEAFPRQERVATSIPTTLPIFEAFSQVKAGLLGEPEVRIYVSNEPEEPEEEYVYQADFYRGF